MRVAYGTEGTLAKSFVAETIWTLRAPSSLYFPAAVIKS